MAVRRVTFRLYPNGQQEQVLRYHRKLHKDLYNAAVSNRFTQYKKFNHKVEYFEQQNSLPAFKEVLTEYKEIASQALQATLKRVDYAFQRWFKGLGKRPKFKSIRHYSGWTYPAKSGYKIYSIGDNGYLELTKIGSIQMRGKARLWGTPTTCTILYRNNNWYASITVDVDDQLLKESRQLKGNRSCGIDLGCLSAVSLVSHSDGKFATAPQVEPPKFLRKAEKQIKQLSKEKRRKRASNGRKKVRASSRYRKAQKRVSTVIRKVANCRQNWVHDIANRVIKSGHSLVAMEKIEVSKMTRKAKKAHESADRLCLPQTSRKGGKRKKQKAGLNKSILDIGFGMLTGAIRYKVEESGGTFIDVPTRQVKPSQTCPKCGSQRKKELSERTHNCSVCRYTLDRDYSAALVMLLWAIGQLPASGTGVVGDDVSSSTAKTPKRAGSMRQLGQAKRQKSKLIESGLETQASTK